tara:strand:- start:31 stop:294 length:264 start_codon:yes stop_codon:yes gene_type:complete
MRNNKSPERQSDRRRHRQIVLDTPSLTPGMPLMSAAVLLGDGTAQNTHPIKARIVSSIVSLTKIVNKWELGFFYETPSLFEILLLLK